MRTATPSVTRLLTRHFLRRFFENDLISPHVDLHENTFAVCAAIISTGLFASVMIGSKYMFGMPPPGIVAVQSVGDSFLFLAVSMLGMALVAALQWDALSLDARDTANLGPLPIPRTAIVRAKLAALTLFALGFLLALNLLPTMILPSLTVVRMPVGLSGLLRLVSAHAAASLLAGAFGFLAVVALREVLRAALGAAWFARISPLLQGALVLAFMSALFLTPAGSGRVTSRWMHSGFPAASVVTPVVWFVGLEHALGGGPVVRVTRVNVGPRMAPQDARARASYRAREPYFRDAGRTGLAAVAVVGVLAVAAYAWNLRRVAQPLPSGKRRGAVVAGLGALLAPRDRLRRAGFIFAVQALVRSPPHRLSMAGAGALAVAMAFVLLSRVGLRPVLDPGFPSASVLGVQTVVVSILLAGFRRAVRVPAELRANWILQMTWQHGERRFLSGVRLAALVIVATPVLVALVPLHVWMISAEIAALHFVIGFLFSIAVVNALFAGCNKVPFASSYEPLSHVKTIGPIVFLLFLMFVNTFARLERSALSSEGGAGGFVVGLVAVIAALRGVDYWRMRAGHPMKFEEPPEPATQWLGLSG